MVLRMTEGKGRREKEREMNNAHPPTRRGKWYMNTRRVNGGYAEGVSERNRNTGSLGKKRKSCLAAA